MAVAQLARQRGKYDREALLGRVLFYFVPESTQVPYQEAVDALQAAGFTRTMPFDPEEADVFQRVTPKEFKKRIERNDGQVEKWLIRPISSDGERIIRRLIMELVDPEDRILEFEQVADIVYDRKKNALIFEWLEPSPDSRGTASQIMNEIEYEYHKWKGNLHAYAIREWIRKTIMGMHAVPAKRSGGVYFIEEHYAGQIDALETFVHDFLPEDAEFHSIEIPDDDKQREMVKRAIIRDTSGAIEQKMIEIEGIRKAGKLTSKRYMDLMEEVAAIRKKMDIYLGLLKENRLEITETLELLENQMKIVSPLQITPKKEKK